MKKISWGTGIVITLGIFLVINIIVVIFAFSEDVHLVTDDYYAKELKYQDVIDMKNNSAQLRTPLTITINGSREVTVKYPVQMDSVEISGSVHFYRPDHPSFDFTVPVKRDSNNEQLISSDKIIPGYWKVAVEWTDGKLKYFNEEKLMVQ
ncbi:MAG: FixH family protein [Ignavibacteriaceae bacterium]|nr:FixH family protein [Ignavibacteriaceae bacterium]